NLVSAIGAYAGRGRDAYSVLVGDGDAHHRAGLDVSAASADIQGGGGVVDARADAQRTIHRIQYHRCAAGVNGFTVVVGRARADAQRTIGQAADVYTGQAVGAVRAYGGFGGHG
ncbi:hypothetical protein RZS08_03675, partial [Arthrospira platensis SPKY1]|nr:hypothetical protein [Arthrospira platensis SPKY1]